MESGTSPRSLLTSGVNWGSASGPSPGAATATFFARRDSSGSVVARADLYQRDDIAQIENVFTSERQRGSGSATALVVTALSHAQANGSSIIFLVADAEDWPKVLYRRLGFHDAGLVTSWHRASDRAR